MCNWWRRGETSNSGSKEQKKLGNTASTNGGYRNIEISNSGSKEQKKLGNTASTNGGYRNIEIFLNLAVANVMKTLDCG
jgi:hypothetical protein